MRTREAEGADMATHISIKHLIPSGTLPGSGRAEVFVGREHGNVPVSMFLVNNGPGDGPELHRHPYAEVFVVHAGQARFQLEDTSLTAGRAMSSLPRPGRRTASPTLAPESCR